MSILIEKLPLEIKVWKKAVDGILNDDDYHKETNLKIREGEKTIIRKLINFSRFQDFNPNLAKTLTDELKNHEKYHSPKWEDLGTFRRICNQYYTKDKDAYEAFKRILIKDTDEWLLDNRGAALFSDKLGFYFSNEFENVSEDYEESNDDEYDDDEFESKSNFDPNLDDSKILTPSDLKEIVQSTNSWVDVYSGSEWVKEIKWVQECKPDFMHLLNTTNVRVELFFSYMSWLNGRTGFFLLCDSNGVYFFVFLNDRRESTEITLLANELEQLKLIIEYQYLHEKLINPFKLLISKLNP